MADGDILPGDQYELYLAGRFNDTPILVGTNSDEGAAFARSPSSAKLFEQYVRNNFGSEADEILSVYPHANDFEASQSTKDLGRDNIFAWHTWTWARLQSLKGKNKAFVYYFDHRTPLSQGSGASHSAELPYVFGNLRSLGGTPKMPPPGFGQSPRFSPGGGFPNAGPSTVEKALSDLIMSTWVNFRAVRRSEWQGLATMAGFQRESTPRHVFWRGFSRRKDSAES